MKIKVVKASLMSGLGIVKDTCTGKDFLNVFRCIRLAADDGMVRLTASNECETVTTAVACDVIEDGVAVIPGAELCAFVGALQDGEVEIGVGEHDAMAVVKGGACRYRIAVADESAWPMMAEIGVKTGEEEPVVSTFEIDTLSLSECFRKVDYAASTDETRRALNGVNVAHADGVLTFVATDGKRLSVVEVEREASAAFSVTLTSATVKRLRRLAGKDANTLAVETDGKQIRFRCDACGWTLQAKTVSDAYPNWRRVVPSEIVNEVTVDREVLLDELRRVSLSHNENGSVKIKLDQAGFVISAKDCDKTAAYTSFPAKYDGPALERVVSPKYMMEALSATSENDVRIAFGTSETAPVRIACAVPFVAVVMPYRG